MWRIDFAPGASVRNDPAISCAHRPPCSRSSPWRACVCAWSRSNARPVAESNHSRRLKHSRSFADCCDPRCSSFRSCFPPNPEKHQPPSGAATGRGVRREATGKGWQATNTTKKKSTEGRHAASYNYSLCCAPSQRAGTGMHRRVLIRFMFLAGTPHAFSSCPGGTSRQSRRLTGALAVVGSNHGQPGVMDEAGVSSFSCGTNGGVHHLPCGRQPTRSPLKCDETRHERPREGVRPRLRMPQVSM